MDSKIISQTPKVSKPLGEPSQTIMTSLSVVMLIFALAGLMSYSDAALESFKQEKPFLAGSRDEFQDGVEFLANRMRSAPILYGVAHIVPAIIWSILVPIQHMASVRKDHIGFHRFSGWLIVLSSIALSISGSLFPLFNLSYSDPDLFHVHYLLIPVPLFKSALYLPFPTFNLQLKLLPLIQLFPLYKAIQEIRVYKNISNHKYWMTLHTIAGYLISIQRVASLVSMAIGWLIFALPKNMEEKLALAFHFPPEDDQVKRWEIERSAFALTLWTAFLASAFWVYQLVGKEQQKIHKAKIT